MATPAKVTGIWDNGGKTVDRYTVAVEPDPDAPWRLHPPTLALSLDPCRRRGSRNGGGTPWAAPRP